MRLLELGISTYLSAPDSVILVRREFPVGRGGLEDRNPPWQVVYAWASLTVRGEAIGGREGRGQ